MSAGLTEKDFNPDPFAEFALWFKEGVDRSGKPNPNAMTLCTVGSDGWPQGRIVLLKGWDREGFRFFTNSHSEKGHALAAHPQAELVFHWDSLGRQLRIRGAVSRLSDADTEEYFSSRPRGSRLAAWASQQSEPVASREAMEAQLAEMEKRFEGQAVVPHPPHWWGYRVAPQRIEFWQEGPFRFHDRFVYTMADGQWSFTRLNP